MQVRIATTQKRKSQNSRFVMLKAQSQTKQAASESYKVRKRKKRRRSGSLNRTQILSRVLQVDVWESPDSLKEFPFVFALVLFCCQVKYSIFRYALEEAAVAVDLSSFLINYEIEFCGHQWRRRRNSSRRRRRRKLLPCTINPWTAAQD